MKIRKNKLILVVTIFFLAIAVYYYFNYIIDAPINQIQVLLQGNTNSIDSESDIRHIIDSFDTARKVEDISTSDFIPLQLKLLNTKDEESIRNLFVDYNNVNIYFREDSDSKLYKITEDNELFLLTHESFNDIYKDRTPPTLKINLDKEEIKYNSNTEWSYRKLDGIYYSTNSTTENSQSYSFKNHSNLILNYSREPSKVEYTLYKDDSIVTSGELDKNSFDLPKVDGNYSLSTEAIYNDAINGFKGKIETQLNFKMDLPPKFILSKEEIYQGNLLRIDVENLNSNETPFIDQNISKWFSFNSVSDGKAYGYIPISYNIKSGQYNITYGINNKNVGKLSINILPRDFNIQYLTVDNDIEESTRNDAAYNEYYKYYLPTRYESNNESYSEESFILPAKGRLTTEYGERRYVNNEPTSYHHAGLDIAAPTGTTVLATNSGKVKLSMFLTLTGNTVVIDHGNGFFSTYFHLNKRSIEEGEMVNVGEKIGEVGTTGFSTGPHLHFMISYYDQNLDPGYLIYNQPVTYENYKSLFNLE
ncbi:M23 family metallopeptidase [Sporosalibacterium faouarense]|uniref:M23 family metallopeptidase n=1 Tax=Sporosalibacterium faouarense TaxID=516123 RepID=UPI00192C0BE9|nr:M23 family metallopeptidase [Sporosalibacterium faouarense]